MGKNLKWSLTQKLIQPKAEFSGSSSNCSSDRHPHHGLLLRLLFLDIAKRPEIFFNYGEEGRFITKNGNSTRHGKRKLLSFNAIRRLKRFPRK
jgi:hypothetical protein